MIWYKTMHAVEKLDMEYKQLVAFVATTQVLANYSHVKEKQRML